MNRNVPQKSGRKADPRPAFLWAVPGSHKDKTEVQFLKCGRTVNKFYAGG